MADALVRQAQRLETPISDDDLAWLEQAGGQIFLGTCSMVTLSDLIAEVRRLRRENQLLHLSRGTAPGQLVGMD